MSNVGPSYSYQPVQTDKPAQNSEGVGYKAAKGLLLVAKAVAGVATIALGLINTLWKSVECTYSFFAEVSKDASPLVKLFVLVVSPFVGLGMGFYTGVTGITDAYKEGSQGHHKQDATKIEVLVAHTWAMISIIDQMIDQRPSHHRS